MKSFARPGLRGSSFALAADAPAHALVQRCGDAGGW